MFRVIVRVRVRSQEAPAAEPRAVQLSPQRAEWITQGRLPVWISLWVLRPDKYMGHPSGRPQESSRAALVALCK